MVLGGWFSSLPCPHCGQPVDVWTKIDDVKIQILAPGVRPSDVTDVKSVVPITQPMDRVQPQKTPSVGSSDTPGVVPSDGVRPQMTPSVGSSETTGVVPSDGVRLQTSPSVGSSETTSVVPSDGVRLQTSPSSEATGVAPDDGVRFHLSPSVGSSHTPDVVPSDGVRLQTAPSFGSSDTTGVVPSGSDGVRPQTTARTPSAPPPAPPPAPPSAKKTETIINGMKVEWVESRDKPWSQPAALPGPAPLKSEYDRPWPQREAAPPGWAENPSSSTTSWDSSKNESWAAAGWWEPAAAASIPIDSGLISIMSIDPPAMPTAMGQPNHDTIIKRILADDAFIAHGYAQGKKYIRCLGHRYPECQGYMTCDAEMRHGRSHRAFCRECQKGVSELEKDLRHMN
jgi:hypothetical protein